MGRRGRVRRRRDHERAYPADSAGVLHSHPRASAADSPERVARSVLGLSELLLPLSCDPAALDTLDRAVGASGIAPRVSLAYLGGVAFGRTESELEISYVPIRPTIIPIPPSVNESIDYGVAPMVGVEGRIRLAGHVALVPGLRLHGTDGGWLIRPSLGLAWMF